jgi:thioredoxin-like negative regulator of GroEL
MNININTVQSFDELQNILKNKSAVLVYFSHDRCNVCKVLKPKVAELLEGNFSKMEMLYVNTEKLPEVAGQYRVFTVPTVLVFFEGKESLRYSRNFSISELAIAIERPYNMLFEG